ncbi:MAG: CBS domain-containing protein [Alphaproteobacteria bacterium]|nr:CBS domain-containing protein [Alphaproteobacteria bacterium]MBF0250653.1 CBS domain-containing protein [Alphaproteobacteria bacterium]
MFVKSILDEKNAGVITVKPGDTIRQVAQMFKALKIGFAVVDDGDSECAGCISERDIIHHMAEHGEFDDVPVSAVMRQALSTVHPDMTLDEVRDLMTTHRTRHVVVCNGESLLGVVSIGDLIKHSLTECRVDTAQMRDYIAGHGYQ